jgi:hypothetical protein
MRTSDEQKKNEAEEQSEPKEYYVHNDIVFIAGYVTIDSEEPLEIIQCYVDVEKESRKALVTAR